MAQYSRHYNDYLPQEKTNFEVVMVADANGNLPNGTNSGIPISIAGTNLDAFGRLRVSQPLTLFDSFHRYSDNGLWCTLSVGAGTTYTHNQNQGLVDLTVGTGSTASIIRETTKVFSYQPGKSLLFISTFVLNPSKQNLRQRVGYFGGSNGIYLELDGTTGDTVYFVKRTSISGITTDIRVAQSDWNVDTLTGTGPSKLTLDITKSQILWSDIEWLGDGTVRIGFMINGKFIHCHSFDHANIITSTYMTTACLPLRYEISNTGITTSTSTLKQICSTVISEGGYELRGLQQAVKTPITQPKDLTNVGTYYPVISLRLKTSPDRLDAIVILTALSILGITNNANYSWEIRANSTTSGGSWVANSSVEYNITGTSIADGRILASGFTIGSNQGSTPVNILRDALFKFQLERNGLTGTPYEISLAIASDTAGADVLASLDWEEITR